MPLKDNIPEATPDSADYARRILIAARQSFRVNKSFIGIVTDAKATGLTNQDLLTAIDVILPNTSSEIAPYYSAIKSAIVAYDSEEDVPDLT